MCDKLKKRTHDIMEKAQKGDVSSKIFDIFIILLISSNVLAVILGTVKSFSQYNYYFHVFETVSVVVFTIEYVLRLWSSTSDKRYRGWFIGRVRYFFTPLAIIDLLAILPFYIPMVLPLDLRFLRVVRLIRIFRLFKIGRYSKSFDIFRRVLKSKKEQLLITLFMVFILLTLSSSFIYYAEHKVQPDTFSDIPSSYWWSIVTLATVGYGDAIPVTSVGKIVGMFVSLLGIGMFALPAGILGSGFFDEIQKRKTIKCPHCGKRIRKKDHIIKK